MCLVGQLSVLVRKWPMVDRYIVLCTVTDCNICIKSMHTYQYEIGVVCFLLLNALP